MSELPKENNGIRRPEADELNQYDRASKRCCLSKQQSSFYDGTVTQASISGYMNNNREIFLDPVSAAKLIKDMDPISIANTLRATAPQGDAAGDFVAQRGFDIAEAVLDPFSGHLNSRSIAPQPNRLDGKSYTRRINLKLNESTRERIDSEFAGRIIPKEGSKSRYSVDAVSACSTESSYKNCACSLCCKAALVWSELNCEDVKDRLSVMNRSIARVSNAISRSSYGNTEDDLSRPGKSLLLRTQTKYYSDSMQLKANLQKLEEIRKNCMRNAGIFFSDDLNGFH